MLSEKLFSKQCDVRKLNEEDIENIYQICKNNTLYYKYCPPFVTYQSIKEDMKALPDKVSINQKYYVGYFKSGKLLAIMDLIENYPDNKTVFIGFFMSDISIQNRGFSSSLIEELCQYLKVLNYKYIQLAWIFDNPQAQHFWLKNGFKPIRKTVSNSNDIVMLAIREL